MKVGLALGGGGARGAVHIGVLTELERLGLKPDLVVGTSIGGLLGALYAAGMDAEGVLAFFRQIQVDRLYALPGNSWSLASNSKIERLLEDSVGRIRFEDLVTPLAVMATDLRLRKLVVLDEGDLISAVLATIALPIVLPPVERNGRLLVDGGLLNNVPFDVAYARGMDRVLAIDLTNAAQPGATLTETDVKVSGRLERVLAFTQRYGTWQVLSAVVDILTEQSLKTRLALTEPDLLLRPYVGTIGLLDFHRFAEGLLAGKTIVQKNEDKIINLFQGEAA